VVHRIPEVHASRCGRQGALPGVRRAAPAEGHVRDGCTGQVGGTDTALQEENHQKEQ